METTETVATKKCIKCGVEKPLSGFHRNRHKPDGHHSTCKPCAIAGQNISRGKPPKIDKVKWAPKGMKVCVRCSKPRMLDSFPRYRHSYDGRHHTCKTCMSKNRPKYVPGKYSEQNRRTYWADPEKARDRRAKQRLGVPHGTYAKLLAAQDGKCAICDRTDNFSRTRFAFDHCHESGEIRGLLCTCCNQAIGQLRHDIDTLRRAIAYLEDPPARHVE